MNCPSCNSTTYEKGPLGSSCKRCGYINDPDYLKKLDCSFKSGGQD